jgi:hypothetical protein
LHSAIQICWGARSVSSAWPFGCLFKSGSRVHPAALAEAPGLRGWLGRDQTSYIRPRNEAFFLP